MRGARGAVPTHAAHVLARDVGPHLDALEAVAVAGAAAPAGDCPAWRSGRFLLGAEGRAGARAAGGPRRAAAAALDRDRRDDPQLAWAPTSSTFAIASRPLRRRGIRLELLFEETLVLVGTPAWAARLPAAALDADPAAALADVLLLAFDDDLPPLRRYWW